MATGEVLREVRVRRGFRQEEVADAGFVSNKLVSAIENNRRAVAPDVMERVCVMLDDIQLYMEAGRKATGGVLVGPWLNGDKVDLGRLSVAAKATEEATEALQALPKAMGVLINARSAKDLTDMDRKTVGRALHEMIEASTAFQISVGVISQTYGFSLAQLYEEHRTELETKGFLKREKPPTKAAR